MTSEELEAAAEKLNADAKRYRGDVAQQLIDRADQLRSHAFNTRQYEEAKELQPAEMSERYERDALLFLQMAGRPDQSN